MKEVVKISNFLSQELYFESFETAKSLLKIGKNVFCTNNWWDRGIVEDSFPVFIHNINKQSDLHIKLKSEIEEKADGLIGDASFMFYYWTRFSYIPWHQDYMDKIGFTLYLNDDWGKNHGGYFLYKDPNNEQEIKAIMPEKNLAVIQKKGVWHTTTPVNFDGHIRYTIQAFLKEK